jgi:hypothetical protein
VKVAVVGSGFSGIAIAHALIARGLTPTMIDVGETLEARRSAVVAKLHDLAPSQWSPDDFRFINENPTLGRHAIPKRVYFGSESIYASDRSFAPIESGPGSRLPYPTFTKGGYSNIWGAAMLPPDACDTTDWPVRRSEMEPYFRAAARLVPLAGGEGTLDSAFPSYKDRLGDLDPGPQGEALLRDLRRVGPRLAAEQMLYGRARLAVHTDAAEGALPCINCGHCFTGCVYGSIYETEPQVAALVRSGRLAYHSGLFVESVEEADGRVDVHVVDVSSSAHQTFEFDAIFLAGGPINTTRLLLRSGGLYDVPVLLKESQKFVLPMLRLRAAETAIEHPSVTMASVFIETKVPELSDHWVHVQAVPMNELIVKGAPIPGIRSRLGRRLYKPLLQRMMAAWCGMHSDHSNAVELRLRSTDAARRTVLDLNVRISETARGAAHTVAKHLFRKGLSFGTAFVYPQIWRIVSNEDGSEIALRLRPPRTALWI